MQEITAAHKIADMILDELVPTRFGRGFILSMDDCRGDNPNRYMSPTETGIALELNYGMPCIIHTPAGAWRFSRSGYGNFTEVFSILTDRLGLESNPIGHGFYGPFYAITRLDGEPLPPLKYRTGRPSPEESKRIWNS